MARKTGSGSAGCGCLVIVVLIGIGLYVSDASKGSAGTMVGLIVGTVLVFSILKNIFFRPSTCDICGNVLRRGAYLWQVNGRKQRVCPKCNQGFERHQSKRAMKRMGL